MSRFQMINRDTGQVVYQAEAKGWRQFKIAYVQWAQTSQQGILSIELQEIRRFEERQLCLSDEELRVLGRLLVNYAREKSEQALLLKIQRFLEGL